MINKSIKKRLKIISVLGIFIAILNFNLSYSFENEKNEFGAYFGTKIYEERHPVDNSFFMSQDEGS